MIRNRNFARNAVVAIVFASILLAAAFLVTKRSWYDELPKEQRIHFWNEFAVAYGTLALAVVTWASVYETQQVLADEDLRFRRARMPVVVMQYARLSNGGLEIAIENIGDGAARDVHLTYSAHVNIAWDTTGLTGRRDKVTERDFTASRVLFASYLGEKRNGSETFDRDVSSDVLMVNPEITVAVRFVRIDYLDVFGSNFQTEHIINDQQAFNQQRFKWVPPPNLVPEL